MIASQRATPSRHTASLRSAWAVPYLGEFVVRCGETIPQELQIEGGSSEILWKFDSVDLTSNQAREPFIFAESDDGVVWAIFAAYA